MDLKEFLQDFAEKYSIKHINDIEDGIIKENIKGEIYLVEKRS